MASSWLYKVHSCCHFLLALTSDPMQMESNYYRNLEYINFSYFPVLPEDYDSTSDRPGCEKPHWTAHYSTQVMCN